MLANRPETILILGPREDEPRVVGHVVIVIGVSARRNPRALDTG
jgi:hypothetical protein